MEVSDARILSFVRATSGSIWRAAQSISECVTVGLLETIAPNTVNAARETLAKQVHTKVTEP